jgi:hypothetical protein
MPMRIAPRSKRKRLQRRTHRSITCGRIHFLSWSQAIRRGRKSRKITTLTAATSEINKAALAKVQSNLMNVDWSSTLSVAGRTTPSMNIGTVNSR